jgi:hypothetical protein
MGGMTWRRWLWLAGLAGLLSAGAVAFHAQCAPSAGEAWFWRWLRTCADQPGRTWFALVLILVARGLPAALDDEIRPPPPVTSSSGPWE